MADKIVSRTSTHVTVNLAERRLYAKRPHGRGEYYIGPGEVTVPRYIAESWGLDLGAEPPWDAYDEQSADQVLARSAGLSDAERKAVIAYETAGKGRKTVLEGLGAPAPKTPTRAVPRAAATESTGAAESTSTGGGAVAAS